MKVGNLVKYQKWHGIIVETKAQNLVEGEDVMVLWSGMPAPSWHPVELLEVISESGRPS